MTVAPTPIRAIFLASLLAVTGLTSPAYAQSDGLDAPSTGAAQATPDATDIRPEVKEALPKSQLVGKTRLRVFGFQIYDARLWAAPGFGGNSYASQPLALELTYLREFKAQDIAERSIKEMRRSASITDAQESKWLADLLRVVPNVKKGDRILGVHQPGVGASYWVNGKPAGEVRDAEFARLFFGIWLSPKTSEPAMRDALLGGKGP